MALLLLPPTHRAPPPRFSTAGRAITLPCYQLYAVERWVAARDRHPLLLVYTGLSDHTVVLDAYAPHDQHAWDDVLAALRAHGAKPRQTPHGTLMLTSLAHFRSDYTIVHIPSGNYLAAQDQLYANIDLLRTGCSGRSALTLEDPSDSTKDRFIAAYHLPENTLLPNPASADHLPLPTKSSPQIPHLRSHNQSTAALTSRKPRDRILLGKTKDRTTFIASVLELVKLVQAALAVFGLFPSDITIDGLLCDYTVQGIEKWVAHIGSPCVGLESTDRVADPSFVAALLSLVLATRNRLAYLGYSFVLPRDPFLYPHAFSLGLAAYLQATAPPSVGTNPASLAPQVHHHHQLFSSPHGGSIHVSTPFIPPAPAPTSILSAAAASAAAAIAGAPAPLPVGAVLTRDIIDAVAALHDQKIRTESRRVRRVLKNKLAPGGGVDSDGAEATAIPDRDRDYSRKHTLSLSMSLSGGEEPAPNTLSSSPSGPAQGGKSQQLLSGIASGLRGGSAALANVGVNVGGGGGGAATGDGSGDPGTLFAPTSDLAAFVRCVAGSGTGPSIPSSRGSGKGHRKSRESADFGLGGGAAVASAAIGYAYAHMHEKDVVGASVRALWSGRVSDLVRMREEVDAMQESSILGVGDLRGGREKGKDRDKDKEREKEKRRRRGPSPAGVASDGDESYGATGAARSYDGRSTEEESDMTHASQAGGSQSFGGMWSGRVRGKIGTWTGLGRRKHYSVDLGMTSSAGASQHGKDKEREKESTPPFQSEAQPSSSQTLLGEQQQQQQERLPGRPTPGRLITGSILSRRTSGTTSRRASASRAQSPTLPPMVFSTDMDRDVDDDDLLSSGQASPLSDYRPSPFNMPLNAHDPNASIASSNTNLTALGPLLGAAHKRPWGRRLVQSARVASWADPVSARSGGEEGDEDSFLPRKSRDDEADEDDEDGRRVARSVGSDEDGEDESDVSRLGAGLAGTRKRRREKTRFHSLLSVVDGAGVRAEEPLESSEYDDDEEAYFDNDRDAGYLTEDEDGVLHRRKGVVGVDLRRRRSFHDLDTYRGVEVLSPERMAMDVEICGELLTMRRREEHLQNVLACVQILSASLSQTNTSLRAHYESHAAATTEIERRASVLAELDTEHVQADKIFQATNTLRYESEQFNADDLWQAARPPRRTVFALRDKVLGTGGRRLRAGVHGAHGPYNRIQWALDGRARHVDHLGRTESEAEEEHALERLGVYLDRHAEAAEEAEDEEGDVVEHPGIKPMWLLRFFTSWGARWSAVATSAPVNVDPPKEAVAVPERVSRSATH
ncbi:hypothetical protein BDN70DRAFT_910221 [Pholiota conissans]|uniref:STB6-like N-terminal domain-containing protein n=1 Tax=Pholiota conissans TaxID=109636 RepID=A0A9P5ZDA3_9AGAR|nr:hypothetical protein BDN70DRAFT_910221 [Pholiota conissans]